MGGGHRRDHARGHHIVTADEFQRQITQHTPVGTCVSLTGVVVTEPVDLSGQTLGSADLSGVTFQASVTFASAHFSGLSWFKNVRFYERATFDGATFANDARFDGSTFEAAASFATTEFHGVAGFDNVNFKASADFSGAIISGNLSGARANFDGAAIFRDAQCLGGVWLDQTRFGARVEFSGTEVHGRTWLRNARINGSDGTSGTEKLAATLTSFGYLRM